MQSITICLSPELDFFLPADQRTRAQIVPVDGAPAVKHPIEAVGVPHTEVGLILRNGRPVSFAAPVQTGDALTVFGIEDAPPVAGAVALRGPIPVPVRFVLDTHLGRLAHYLRLLGFDACYDNHAADPALAALAAQDRRVLLTRDRGLLKRKIVEHGYCLRTTRVYRQVVDVLRRYDLVDRTAPFTRCAVCNGLLIDAPKADILHRLEPKTRRYYHAFKRCPGCDRIYWQGSHTARTRGVLTELLETAAAEQNAPRSDTLL